jgi:hypothetical protein
MSKDRARYQEFKPQIVPGVGIIMDIGTTVPTSGTAGYATGCLFLHTDGGSNTSLYVNEGSNTSCSFVAK